MANIVVIGGGASGLLASSLIAENGNSVTLVEKNEKLGKKLYITGKGRCNVTNDCSPRDFLDSVVTNPKFLTGAINAFSSEDMMNLLQEEGLTLTVERGERVFPASSKSSDVIRTLVKRCERFNVKILLNTEVKHILKKNGIFEIGTSNGILTADKVIVATGGVSYPVTGSTGDGYIFAKIFGHTVIKPRPSLCPVILKDTVVKQLEGLSLKNVNTSVRNENGKIIAEEFGEMLFTADGVSGPVILTLSSKINKIPDMENLLLSIDLKPALDEKTLDARVLKDFAENNNKAFKNSLGALLPQKLIPVIVELSGIDGDAKVNTITSENRKNFVKLLKNLTFSVKSLDAISRAVITSGGVNVKEINPKTMESKIVDGLFFIGEVLDVDALTGGFNLQIAFSTASAASRAIG